MNAKDSISRDPVLRQRRAVGGVICLVTDFMLSQRRDVVNETFCGKSLPDTVLLMRNHR
ncbi:MAG: hypothetical protein R3C12_06280 [Planctomycetaceae bacterium]|nr:hypothetical protein [Planctomycetaceae bacterium]